MKATVGRSAFSNDLFIHQERPDLCFFDNSLPYDGVNNKSGYSEFASSVVLSYNMVDAIPIRQRIRSPPHFARTRNTGTAQGSSRVFRSDRNRTCSHASNSVNYRY
jgi:hypothetical protein